MRGIIRRKTASVVSALLIAAMIATPAVRVNAEGATQTDSDMLISTNESVIRDNITINGIDVGGMSLSTAEKELGGNASIGDAAVSLTSQYGDVDTTLNNIGLTDDTEEVIQKALAYGNSGNILKRYKDIESLKTTPVDFEITKGVNVSALSQVIENGIGAAMSGDNEYSLDKHEDGSVKVIVEGDSVSVDAAATKAAIDTAINEKGYSGAKVKTAIVMADNSGSEKMQQIARVTDLLGTYTTSYSSSGASRKNNVQRAASLVDGHLLFPGEQISVYNCIAPIDTSNGYEMAHTYVGTEVVDGAGGGVCQVATTLYNAAIRAELEVVQRNCHSLRVSYVPIAADAAIAGGVLDLKLRNNLDAPIYIEALYDGANLSFNNYGEEYRPANRTIEFESIQTGVINPPDEPIYTEDKSLEPGTEEVTAAAVTGYTGELWKHIYEDGVEVDKVCINKSKYQASATKISVNTDPPEEEEGEEGEETEDEDDNTGEGEGGGEGEAAPAEPAASETPPAETPTE